MSIRSLIVKVGAQTEELDKALARAGSAVKRTDGDLKKLGNQPLGDEARRSLDALTKTIDGITAAQTRQATNARLAAAGLEQIGGVSRLTRSELESINRTLQNGLDAYRALGQQAPSDLKRVADAVSAQKSALDGVKGSTSSMLGAFAPIGAAVAGAFTVGRIAAFAKEVVDLGGSLTDMRDKTGISVEGLQQLKAAAELSGNTLDQVTGAVSQMQNRMASGDASAVTAIRDLGLSLDGLKKQAPDEQFRAIARAIADVEDPAERTRIAIDLFGRAGADLLPTLVSDIDAVANATTVMSTDTAEALDRAGDAWTSFSNTLKAQAANVLAALLPRDKRSQFAFVNEEDLRMVDRLAGNTGNLATALDLAAIRAQSIATTLDGFVSRPGVGEPLAVPGLPSPEVMEASDRALRKLAQANEENRRKAEDARRASDQMLRSMASTEKAITNLSDLKDAVRGLGQNWNDLQDTQKITVGFSEFDQVLKKLGNTTIPTAEQEAERLGLTLGDYGPTLDQLGTKSEKAGADLDGLAQAFARIAQVSGGAFGGAVRDIANVITALDLAKKAAEAFKNAQTDAARAAALLSGAAAIGQSTGSGSLASRTIGGAATGAQLGAGVGGALGGPAGEAIGGIVGLIGGGIVGLFRGLFGNNPEKQINPQREAFVQSFRTIDADGITEGFDALNRKANEAGITINRLLNAKNPREYQAAVDELTVAFARQERATRAVDGAVAGLAGAVSSAGGRMPADLRATIGALAEMSGLSEENKRALSELAAAAAPNFNDLQNRASQFGITLQQLGPAFQQADLETRAKSITDLFEDLTSAGGDAGGILAGLSDDISTLVNDSAKFGGAIPENMKPLIESLILSGQLTDEQGQKIKDLTGIKFEETPLDKGTNAIVDAIKELKDAIEGLPSRAKVSANGVKEAFEKTRPRLLVDIDYIDPGFIPPDPGQGAATGGLVTPTGIQHFSRGGRVLPFLRRGTDTVPAMLTPGEIILNAAQQRAVAAQMGGSTGVVWNGNVVVNGYVDSPAAQRRLGRIVNEELGRLVRRQKQVGAA